MFQFLKSHQANFGTLTSYLFFILYIATVKPIYSQKPSLTLLEYRPFRNGSVLFARKDGNQVFQIKLSPQQSAKHGLLDIFHYQNSLIIGQRSDVSSVYHVHRVGLDGVKMKSFDIKFPKESLFGTLTRSIHEMAIDAEGNLFFTLQGKEVNEQYASQYLRKYNIDGELLWERVADINTEIKFIEILISMNQGALGFIDWPRAAACLLFDKEKEPSKRIVFYKKPVSSFDQTIHSGSFNYSFHRNHFIHGADGKLYYLSIQKKDKNQFIFIRTEVKSGEILELGNLAIKPHWWYHGVVDEDGNTIIRYTTTIKKKSSETEKKEKVYNSELLIFDPSGKVINNIHFMKDGTDKPEGQRPILAINRHLLYLDKGKINWTSYDEWPGTTLEIINDKEMLENIDEYWSLYPKLGSEAFLFRISENQFALLTDFD